VTNRRIVVVALTVGVLLLGWRALIDVGEWQACGASTSEAVGGALGKGEPSTLECVALAVTKPSEPLGSAPGFAGSTPVPTEADGPAGDEPAVCGDPGLGAYSFTRDANGCEMAVAESGPSDDDVLPGPLPRRFAGVPEVGCSIDPAGIVAPCTSVYVPAVPDDGSCVELRWGGSGWRDLGFPAASLCPNHRGA
jgi:hypothetical protein